MYVNRLYLKAVDSEIRFERTARICTCTLCPIPITRDEWRLTIVHRNSGEPPAGPRGGRIFKRKLFFHPQCLTDWICNAQGNISTVRRCYDCGDSHSREAHYGTIALARGATQSICTKCMSSGRWQFCDCCHHYRQKYHTSPLLIDGVPSERLICDWCADRTDTLTVKEAKRLRRERARATD